MGDSCLFLRSTSEIVEDEHDPNVEIHYKIHKCIIIEEAGDVCPFKSRYCAYKEENEDPTIQKGGDMKFNDGSILLNAVKELDGLFED
jgi:hypothetical protein